MRTHCKCKHRPVRIHMVERVNMCVPLQKCHHIYDQNPTDDWTQVKRGSAHPNKIVDQSSIDMKVNKSATVSGIMRSHNDSKRILFLTHWWAGQEKVTHKREFKGVHYLCYNSYHPWKHEHILCNPHTKEQNKRSIAAAMKCGEQICIWEQHGEEIENGKLNEPESVTWLQDP